MNLRRLIFLSESDWSEDLDFSTKSLRERKDSSAARLTRVENSTVWCPNSAIEDADDGGLDLWRQGHGES